MSPFIHTPKSEAISCDLNAVRMPPRPEEASLSEAAFDWKVYYREHIQPAAHSAVSALTRIWNRADAAIQGNSLTRRLVESLEWRCDLRMQDFRGALLRSQSLLPDHGPARIVRLAVKTLRHDGVKAFDDGAGEEFGWEHSKSMKGYLRELAAAAAGGRSAALAVRARWSLPEILAHGELSGGRMRSLFLTELGRALHSFEESNREPWATPLQFVANILGHRVQERITRHAASFKWKIDPDCSSVPMPESFRVIARMVVPELLGNAVDAFLRGGSAARVLTLKIEKNRMEWRIRVHDSGPGIPRHKWKSVFEEGVTSNGPGRGHGLAIVKETVEQSGILEEGSIRIENSTPRGTTFLITAKSLIR